MLTRNPLFVVSFLFLLSCDKKSTSNYYAFETLNETLVGSNSKIKNSTEVITKSLEDKLTDPATSARSKILYPEVMKVHQLSSDVYNFIDKMKGDIKKTAGLKQEEDKETFNEENKNAVRQTVKRKGKELYEKLISLKDSLFAIDNIIPHEFETTLFLIPPAYNKSESMQQQFLKRFFDDLPAIGALTVLSKFQNSVCVAENKITSLIHDQVTYHPTHYWPWPIISQSSTIVKAGEEVKITAGIGEFMTNNKIEITVNGKKVPLSDIGVAEYSFKTSSVAGTYKVPIKITYSDQDATLHFIDRIITYAVKND